MEVLILMTSQNFC